MTDKVTIDLVGEPQAWSRTRVNSGKRRPIFFVQKNTRSYMNAIRLSAQVAMAGRSMLTGALTMRVTVSGCKKESIRASLFGPTLVI